MATPLLVTGLRSIFLVLGFTMVATLIYTISIDGLPFRRELLTPWMAATLVDFYTILFPIVASQLENLVVELFLCILSKIFHIRLGWFLLQVVVWVVYKEQNAFTAIVWVILLICLGSVTTSFYILLQFLKLSPQESAQDPMYHVLLRTSSKDPTERKGKHSPVLIARIVFSALGCLMLATLLYTILTDGSPFRKELLTPWMVATLIDFYIIIVALSVWVIYKESSWISGVVWVILLICFGGVSTCAFIIKELFQLTSQDPLYLILLNNLNRAENRYERTLL